MVKRIRRKEREKEEGNEEWERYLANSKGKLQPSDANQEGIQHFQAHRDWTTREIRNGHLLKYIGNAYRSQEIQK